MRTFERFCTFPASPTQFVIGKVLVTLLIVAAGAAILLGGGPVLFGFHWTQPAIVLGLTVSYALFAAGFMALLVALLGGDRRSEVISNVVIMCLALAAGSAFPSSQLPPLLRDHVTPLLPPAWFIDCLRALQRGDAGAAGAWMAPAAGLVGIGIGCSLVAGWMLTRRLNQGLRPT